AASDTDPQAVEQTRRNAVRAGIAQDAVRVSVRDAARAQPPFDEPGLIVTNPPYGERISLDGKGSDWEDIGQALRQQFGGWQAWMLTSDPQLPRRIGMRERRRAPLFNGPIECRLFGFEIFAPGDLRPRRGVQSPD
ncbi:MAG: class I SAM-dependent RNA methyltransferase, partial [Steroidobacteraceae bacterium]